VVNSYQNLADENIKYILGEGLPNFALDLISSSGFTFFPCKTPQGIIELTVQKIFSNRRNSISGVFNSSQKTKLKLIGPGGAEDSAIIQNGTHAFTLYLRPKQSGLVLYNLISEDSAGKKLSERLPIEVEQEQRLRILFLQNFPSAEIRSLKNFLSEKGHSVAFRSQTSKNNFSEEFINTPRVRLNPSTPELLRLFDLLMIDSKTMDGLSKSEKSILEKSVFNGLGLIVSQDFKLQKTEFYSIKGKMITNDTVHLSLANKKYVMSALPFEIAGSHSLESILKNNKRILAGYQFFGAGKIGFQLLQETYRLPLEGSHEDYALIWSPLIEKVARREKEKFHIKLNTDFPYYADEPVDFSVISSGQKPEIYSDNEKIPLTEDIIIDDYWHGQTWCGKSGWHSLNATDSVTVNYFIHEPTEWKSLRESNSIKDTSLAQSKSLKSTAIHRKVTRQVSLLLFCVIFLVASGFLWLAPKI
jgi:hypothetical protein